MRKLAGRIVLQNAGMSTEMQRPFQALSSLQVVLHGSGHAVREQYPFQNLIQIMFLMLDV